MPLTPKIHRLALSALAVASITSACTGSSSDALVAVPQKTDGSAPMNSDPEPMDVGEPLAPEVTVDAGVSVDPEPTPDPDPDPEPVAIVEINFFDIWGQEIPEDEVSLEVLFDGQPVNAGGWPTKRYRMHGEGYFDIEMTANFHETVGATIAFDGSEAETGAILVPNFDPDRAGYLLTHDRDSAGLRIHRAFLGARHRYFSSQGRPARRGNEIELLMDGEQAWGTLAADLRNARETIHAATWMFDSNFELERDASTHVTSTPSERYENTIMGIFEASPATKRVMIWEPLQQDAWYSEYLLDDKIWEYSAEGSDDFEVMTQANPASGYYAFTPPEFSFADRIRETLAESIFFDEEISIASPLHARLVDLAHLPVRIPVPLASYHQKFGVIDDEIAYIGGMNFRSTDWDTSEHRVFETRRMNFDATTRARQRVASKDETSDIGPRKDYILRIEGPAVRDAQDVFHQRWEYLLQNDARNAMNNRDFPVERPAAPIANGIQIQVTATLPAPFHESAIGETWLQAIEHAEHFIYIEDQYFRIPMLLDAIKRQLDLNPSLQLIVVTKPVSEWTDGGCYWTAETTNELEQLYPDQFHLFQLRSFDYRRTWGVDETQGVFEEIDVHSKMLIVDDVFMSVGSANKNNRGIVYEGELNTAIVHPTWVREQRIRIFRNLFGLEPAVATNEFVQQFEDEARYNDWIYNEWEKEGMDINLNGADLPDNRLPIGLVYSLDFRDSSYCLAETIGEDVF